MASPDIRPNQISMGEAGRFSEQKLSLSERTNRFFDKHFTTGVTTAGGVLGGIANYPALGFKGVVLTGAIAAAVGATVEVSWNVLRKIRNVKAAINE